ncbi:MAG: hypothetical protein ACYC5N_01475 [Endomicrobiales bacterium]
MLDFYKERRLTNFLDEVIKPSQTVRELKANYDMFTRDKINTGQMDTNVLGAAGMPSSAESIRRFINDPPFAAQVKNAAKEAAKGKTTAVPVTTTPVTTTPAAGNTTTTTGTKNDDAKKDEKPKKPDEPPSTPGGGSVSDSGLIGEALKLATQAERVNSTRADYGPFLSLYGDAADRFVTNNISGELFRDAGGETLSAARQAYGNAHSYCRKKEETGACEADYRAFSERIAEIDKRVNYAKKTSLAEYAGVGFAAFKKEIDGISHAVSGT